MKILAKSTIIAIGALAVSAAPAHAYLDPGAGSMILQGIIGGIAGGLFLARTYWAKMLSFLPGGRGGADEAGDGQEAETAERDQ